MVLSKAQDKVSAYYKASIYQLKEMKVVSPESKIPVPILRVGRTSKQLYQILHNSAYKILIL